MAVIPGVSAQSSEQGTPVVFFPGQRLFPSVFLDPLECQAAGGSYFLFRKDENLSLYSNVSLGFLKPVLAGIKGKTSWEFAFGTSVFTQFDLQMKDGGTYLAGLLNSDYKLTADFSLKKKNSIIRFRLFHISSHLGDDYMLRTNDTLPNDKSVNYEQADLTWMLVKGESYIYAGFGEIYTINVFRKRFSVQAGYLLERKTEKTVSLFTSSNIRLLAENNFYPDIRLAAGISFNRKGESLARIWAEYYYGRLPYGTIDYGRLNWAGLALSMDLF